MAGQATSGAKEMQLALVGDCSPTLEQTNEGLLMTNFPSVFEFMIGCGLVLGYLAIGAITLIIASAILLFVVLVIQNAYKSWRKHRG